jgi:hypothetical protein
MEYVAATGDSGKIDVYILREYSKSGSNVYPKR